MSFVQTVEFTTTHIDEVLAIVDQWVAETQGKRNAHRATLTQDRDRPNTYVQIVEFPSFEAAVANSDLPETGEFARRLAGLCESPPAFRNLEVRHAFDLG